jgi:hypothetical protein
MDVEILGIRPLNNDKPLKAFVDVRLYDLIIRDFRVIQENGCNAYVESPQIVWRGQGGVKQFKSFITLPKGVKQRVDALILAEFFKAREGARSGKGTL